MRRKNIFAILFSLLLAVSMCIPQTVLFAAVGREDHTMTDVSGQFSDWPEGPSLNSEAAILLDASSGEILYKKNADERMYPASITKVLTAYLICQDCDLNETVTFSSNAINGIEPDAMAGDLSKGDKLSVKDCLYLLLLKSSNETAMALAEHDAGSVEEFAKKMNAQAKAFGATSSHFTNPHGLFDEEHYVTASDMARIFWGALQDSTFLTVASTVNHRTAPVKNYSSGIPCGNTHGMFNSDLGEYYEYAVAGKTGHIRKAGYTLVTYARKDEHELLTVTLKAESRAKSYQDTEALFEYGFNKFKIENMITSMDASVREQVAEQIGDATLEECTMDAFVNYVTIPANRDVSEIKAVVSLNPGEETTRTGTVSFERKGYSFATVGLTAQVTLPETTTEAPTPDVVEQMSKEAENTPGIRGVLLRIFLNTDTWLIVIAVGFFIILMILMLIVLTYSKEKARKKDYDKRWRQRKNVRKK